MFNKKKKKKVHDFLVLTNNPPDPDSGDSIGFRKRGDGNDFSAQGSGNGKNFPLEHVAIGLVDEKPHIVFFRQGDNFFQFRQAHHRSGRVVGIGQRDIFRIRADHRFKFSNIHLVAFLKGQVQVADIRPDRPGGFDVGAVIWSGDDHMVPGLQE